MDGEEFRALARRYCDFIKRREDHDVGAFLDLAAASLPELSRAAMQLPDVEGDDLPAVASRTTDEWSGLYHALHQYLGDRDPYWHVHDPTNPTQREPCRKSLAGDFADIYFDLLKGLDLWDGQGRQQQALWEWRWGYWIHWGEALLDALPAIFAWQRKAIDDDL